MRQIVSLKGMAQQILALVILVQLHFGVNCHNILNEVKVTERNSCFKGIYGDTPVRTENIVHMELADTLH